MPPVLNSLSRSAWDRLWERQVQVGRVDRRDQAQRVELCAEVATGAVGSDQTADIALALVACACAGTGVGSLLGGGEDMGDGRRMRYVTGTATFETIEVALPLRIDTVRGDEVLLVQILDVGGVAAGELR